jgi:hypothetical protein
VNAAGASVSQSYSSGSVGGTQTNIGGFVGTNLGTITASYWDKDTSGQGVRHRLGQRDGVPPAWRPCRRAPSATYTDWDFSTVWYQAGDMRPILRSEAAAANADGLITVSNLNQLALIGANLSASYVLTRDIDASSTDASTESFNAAGIWSAEGWVPIGTLGGARFAGNPRRGRPCDHRPHACTNHQLCRPVHLHRCFRIGRRPDARRRQHRHVRVLRRRSCGIQCRHHLWCERRRAHRRLEQRRRTGGPQRGQHLRIPRHPARSGPAPR